MRYNILVTIKRNDQPPYTNTHNHQPLRPGKVASQFDEAIESVMNNVSRNGKYDYNGVMTDTLFVGESVSDDSHIIVIVEVVRA